MSTSLIEPHGGNLIDLMVTPEQSNELQTASRDWQSLDMTHEQLCDLELLLNGAYSPLQGYMTRKDYQRVLSDMRLEDGSRWSLPITLEVPEHLVNKLEVGGFVALRNPEGVMLAALHIEDVWQADLKAENLALKYRRDDLNSNTRLQSPSPWYVGGRLEGTKLPDHFDFRPVRLTPKELRVQFLKLGWRRVLAYQTHDIMHRAHQELTIQEIREVKANLLIQPLVGLSQPDDLNHYTRIRSYQSILSHYPRNTARLALLPYIPRTSDKREIYHRAIITRNFGCTHLIIGESSDEEIASSNFDITSDMREADDFLKELNVEIVPYKKLLYDDEQDAYISSNEVKPGMRVRDISKEDLHKRLDEDRELPEWFTYPEVAQELRRSNPPRHKQGFTVFFTGLSGSGKSTIAKVLLIKFLEMAGRPVTLLDGDIVRKNLSSELGFSKEHRDINIRRIGFVASENTKNGGISICAPIAPYDKIRKDVRQMVSKCGGFILVYVSTPLEECERRDRKGLYAKARAGIIKEFTGISDPYEIPADAEVVIDTIELTPESAAQEIILHLERQGYIGVNDD